MAIDGIGSLSPVNSLNSLSRALQTDGTSGVVTNEGTPAVSFADYMKNALNQANQLQIDAEQVANDFAAGKTDNIQDVTIAAEKADISLQLTLQIRNKILDAYNEIMRMQI